MTVTDEIAAERRRQIEAEGWTAQHDSRHDAGTLLRAAVCYRKSAEAGIKLAADISPDAYKLTEPLHDWPWGREWWKPKNPRHDLIKAGALALAEIDLGRLPEQAQAEHDRIVAEIERIDREGEATHRADGERKMHRYCATFTNKGLYNFSLEFWAESGDAHQVAEDIGGHLGADFCFIDKAGDEDLYREEEG